MLYVKFYHIWLVGLPAQIADGKYNVFSRWFIMHACQTYNLSHVWPNLDLSVKIWKSFEIPKSFFYETNSSTNLLKGFINCDILLHYILFIILSCEATLKREKGMHLREITEMNAPKWMHLSECTRVRAPSE